MQKIFLIAFGILALVALVWAYPAETIVEEYPNMDDLLSVSSSGHENTSARKARQRGHYSGLRGGRRGVGGFADTSIYRRQGETGQRFWG